MSRWGSFTLGPFPVDLCPPAPRTTVTISQRPAAQPSQAEPFSSSSQSESVNVPQQTASVSPRESPEIEIILEITNKFLLFTVQYTEDIFPPFFFFLIIENTCEEKGFSLLESSASPTGSALISPLQIFWESVMLPEQ